MTDYMVLTIDDDANFISLIEAVLNTLNVSMVVAKNGNDGLDMAERLQPDLIVSDMLLPGLGGNELIAHLKQNPATSHIPVIAVTAGGYEVVQKAQAAGSDVLLTKPFNMKEFRDLIQEYATMKV